MLRLKFTRPFFGLLVCIFFFNLLFTSCKKKNNAENQAPTVVKENQSAPSIPIETYVENTIEQVTKEVTKSISAVLLAHSSDFCGGTLDTIAITSNQSIVSVHFDENKICTEVGQQIRRSGTIVLSLLNSNQWKEKGTVLKYEYKRFRIIAVCDTCLADSYLVEMNGIQTRTNLTGGIEDSLKDNESLIIETFARELSYSYPDKPQRVDNMRLKISTTKSGDEVTTTITGIDTVETGAFVGKTNVGIWGKIWNGKDFYLTYIKPKTYKKCGKKSTIVCGDLFYDFRGAYTRSEIYGVDGKTGIAQNSCNCAGAGFLLTTVTQGDSVRKTIYKY